MPVGKKVGVVLAVVTAGGSLALFFRKDASHFDYPTENASDDVFRQRVERRVTAGAAWAKSSASAPRTSAAPPIAPATVSIPEKSSSGSPQPTFHKSVAPVGALLEPIDGISPEDAANADEIASGDDVANEWSEGGQRRHRIADGDTLSRLAVQYLGRAERYLEIFEMNRDVLSSPDLLPIGAVLKVPPRGAVTSPTTSTGPAASN